MPSPEQVTRSLTHCVCDGSGWFRVVVPQDDPCFGQAIMCICRSNLVAQRRAQKLREQSGLQDTTITRFRLQDFDPDACRVPSGSDEKRVKEEMHEIKRACADFARSLQGWLVLVGPYGAGKTHLGYGIAGTCLKADIPVFAGTGSDILDGLRSRYDKGDFDTVFSWVRDVGLLVIDDLGRESPTDWAREKLFQLVNWRYQNAKAMVVTTNFHPGSAEAKQRIDGRILSRLMDTPFSKVMILPAADYRRGHG